MAAIKSTKIQAINLELTLDEEEANFLAAIVQNPSYDGETQKIAEFRKSIFEAIKGPTRTPGLRQDGIHGKEPRPTLMGM
jgi:hypothetical protein